MLAVARPPTWPPLSVVWLREAGRNPPAPVRIEACEYPTPWPRTPSPYIGTSHSVVAQGTCTKSLTPRLRTPLIASCWRGCASEDAIKGVRRISRLRGELSASVRAVIVFCEADVVDVFGTLYGNKPSVCALGPLTPIHGSILAVDWTVAGTKARSGAGDVCCSADRSALCGRCAQRRAARSSSSSRGTCDARDVRGLRMRRTRAPRTAAHSTRIGLKQRWDLWTLALLCSVPAWRRRSCAGGAFSRAARPFAGASWRCTTPLQVPSPRPRP